MTQLPAGHTVNYFAKLTPETLDKAMGAEIVSVFVNSEIRAPLIDQLPDLKLIATVRWVLTILM